MYVVRVVVNKLLLSLLLSLIQFVVEKKKILKKNQRTTLFAYSSALPLE